MIQNTELRINNLVLYRGEVSVVKGVLATSVDLEVKPCINYTKMALLPSIHPIPLTEEWLVRLGIYKQEFGIWNNGDAIYFSYGLEKDIEIKSVHQLQNLFFSLSGKELTITL